MDLKAQCQPGIITHLSFPFMLHKLTLDGRDAVPYIDKWRTNTEDEEMMIDRRVTWTRILMRASSSYARHGRMADRMPETNANIAGPDKFTNSFSHVIAVNWIRISTHTETIKLMYAARKYWSTLWFKIMPPYSYVCNFYKCWPISLMFGTQCTELLCNTTVNWFTHLTYLLLIHYLGKQVQCIMITVSPSPSWITIAMLKMSSLFIYTLFHVSIKCCLRSITSRTGVWYTRSCIMPDIRQSIGLRSRLFKGQLTIVGLQFCASRSDFALSDLLN